MSAQFQHCVPLRNIPENKYNLYLNNIIKKCEICGKAKKVSCEKCALMHKLYNRYYEANIPIDYWMKEIDEFYGDKNLVSLHETISEKFEDFYLEGISLFLKGQHGTGKTLFSSLLLKSIAIKGYNCLYTTLFDMVSVLIQGDYDDRFDAGRELKMIDLLVIDEFDPRFFAKTGEDIYGKVLESIIRIRFQNKLPTILISNNPDPIKAFGTAMAISLDSLISGYCKEIFVTGKDARKK